MNDVCMCVCILGWFLHKPWLLTCPSMNKAFYLLFYYIIIIIIIKNNNTNNSNTIRNNNNNNNLLKQPSPSNIITVLYN